MAYETSPDRLAEDLADPLFTCYVHVGEESDVGWANAVFCYSLLTQINIYLFRDHTHLKQWVGNKRPAGIAFGWTDEVKELLTRGDTDDLGTVLEAMVEAQA